MQTDSATLSLERSALAPMLRTLAAVAFATLALFVPRASHAAWPATGAEVSAFATADQNPVVLSDGQQGVFVAWVSSRTATGQDLYVQRVGPAGDTLWAAGALAVCTAVGDQNGVVMVSDGAGGVILAWQDHRGANLDVYAQHVLSGGTIDGTGSWTANGVAVASGTGDQAAPTIVSDGANGAIVAWQDSRGANVDIYAQHLLANGTLDVAWTATGVALCTNTGDQTAPHGVRDGSGGMIACWDDARAGGPSVFAQDINASGAVQWAANGIDVGNGTKASGPLIAEAAGGGAYLAWNDPNASGPAARVLAQRLSSTGTRLWNSADPATVSTLANATPRAIVTGGADSLEVLYGTSTDLRVRLVTGAGVFWSGAGYISLSTNGPFTGVGAVRVTPGSVLACWEEGGTVLLQLYSDLGTGIGSVVNAAGSATSTQLHPSIALASSGYPMVAWDDDRTPAQAEDIYAQDFSPTGIPGTFHKVVAVPGSGGTLTPTGTQYVADGGTIEFLVRSTGGNYISGVSVNGGASLGPIPNYKFTNVVADNAIASTYSNADIVYAFPTVDSVYRSVAFPLVFPDDSTTHVLVGLGTPNRQVWRFGHWSGADSSYHEAATDLDSMRIGDGYWFVSRDGAPISAVGKPLPEVNRGIPVENKTAGAAGFNQICNPFRFAIADTALRVFTGTTPHAWAGNGFVTEKIQYWDTSLNQYTTTHTLLPGVAYWFEKVAGSNVTIEFPFRTSQGAPGPIPLRPDGADWAIELTAAQQGHAPGRLVLGSAPVAGGARNPFSGARPPHAPMAACDLYVTHADWGAASGDYVEDFSAPAELQTWDVVLGADGALAPGTLSFRFDGVPAGARVRLVDPANGWARDVTDGARAEIAMGGAPRTLRLEVATGAGVLPEAPAARAVFRCAAPSPFAERTALVFSLPERTEFALGIFDVSGRRVYAVSRGTIPGGEHVEVWDGRADDGHRVSPGVYLARWRAGGASGTARLVRIP